MFIIGMIVGIVITLAAVIGYFAWCCHEAGASYDDLVMLGEAGLAAFGNRESEIQVWHNNECLYEALFEEE